MWFREKKQISICIVAVMFVADFVLFGYLPSYKRIKEVEQAREKQRFVIARASSQGVQMPALKEQLSKLQREVGNYESNVPDQRDLGLFLQRIANLMNENSLKEQQVRPGGEIETDKLNCIPLNMQCKGRLSQIFEFYKQLQGLGRLVRIEQVELTNDNSFSGQVSMQTKATIYYRSKARQG